jgi:transketolase
MELHNRQLREIYVDLMIEHAKNDPDIILVEADLMKAAKTTKFADMFPDRSVNVGVAEANMIGVAAGLANMGKKPFTHTFTPFATRRVFDQVMLSVAYAQLPVKMVGSDPGIMAQLNGGTHMSFEDIGLMRIVPTMTIFEPVDGVQLKKILPQIIACKTPVYIRLLRQEFRSIYQEKDTCTLGRANVLREGNDLSIIASGIMVQEALDAHDLLKEQGILARIINIHTIKPIDKDAIIRAARETEAIVTAENHNIINGLGSAVAEVLVENTPVPMERIGIQDQFGQVGKKPYLMEAYHLTAQDIVDASMRVLQRKQEVKR